MLKELPASAANGVYRSRVPIKHKRRVTSNTLTDFRIELKRLNYAATLSPRSSILLGYEKGYFMTF